VGRADGDELGHDRITLFQSMSYPAACSSFAKACFQPGSKGVHTIPRMSEGNSRSPAFSAQTRARLNRPMK
jgi:hypothetical protein